MRADRPALVSSIYTSAVASSWKPNRAASRPNPLSLFEAPRRRGAGVRGTVGWDEAMLRARNQAEQYAKALPVADGWPPFLIVVDVGYSIELFADFSGAGKAYVPFPDSRAAALEVKPRPCRRKSTTFQAPCSPGTICTVLPVSRHAPLR